MSGYNGAHSIQSRTHILAILCKLYFSWNLHCDQLLFIPVIVRKSEEAYQQVQRESQIPFTQQEIMQEIKEIHRILEELEKRIGGDTKGNI